MKADFAAIVDPIALFLAWLGEAEGSEPHDANAMALATVDAEGMPDVRIVLLKECDSNGFVFYSHRHSAKGKQLATNPRAALCFHWKSLRRQVRVRGPVVEATPAEADAYFKSRARQSRIGAWASHQSQPLESRAALEEAFARIAARFGDGDVPRPEGWIGYRLKPEDMEFWSERPHRLHERMRFTCRPDGEWDRHLLYP